MSFRYRSTYSPDELALARYVFLLDLGLGDCDFEENSCRCCCWQNTFVGDVNEWKRARGSTQSLDTGPGYDHTLGNSSGTNTGSLSWVSCCKRSFGLGHYMYLEASTASKIVSNTAKLVSKRMRAITVPNQCSLTMWYHVKGTGAGTLQIKKQPDGAFTVLYPTLFSVSGGQGDSWKNVTVDLYTISYSSFAFTVSIESSRVFSFTSDIAIDDITLSPGCNQYFFGISITQLIYRVS